METYFLYPIVSSLASQQVYPVLGILREEESEGLAVDRTDKDVFSEKVPLTLRPEQ